MSALPHIPSLSNSFTRHAVPLDQVPWSNALVYNPGIQMVFSFLKKRKMLVGGVARNECRVRKCTGVQNNLRAARPNRTSRANRRCSKEDGAVPLE